MTPTPTIPKEHKKALAAVAWLTKLGIKHEIKVTSTEDETNIEIVATSRYDWDHSFTQLFFTRSNWRKRVIGGNVRTTEKSFAYEYDGVSKSGRVNLDAAYRMMRIRYHRPTP